MRIVERDGHKCFTFLRATSLFSELNALEASTNMIASVSVELNTSHMGCIAASHPLSWPAHSCSAPITSWTSSLMTDRRDGFVDDTAYCLPHSNWPDARRFIQSYDLA